MGLYIIQMNIVIVVQRGIVKKDTLNSEGVCFLLLKVKNSKNARCLNLDYGLKVEVCNTNSFSQVILPFIGPII